MNLWVMAEIGKPLHQIIVDFRSWRRVADNETLTGEIMPINLLFGRQAVLARQDKEYLFRPEVLCLAIAPYRRAGNEGDIKLKLADGCDVLCRIAIYQFDHDRRMVSVEGAEQLKEKA